MNIWGVGWIFSTASPGLGAGDLGAGSRGRTAGTPPFSGKLHSEASELLPWGVSVLPLPFMWDGSKTLSFRRDLPPPQKKKPSCLLSTVLTVPTLSAHCSKEVALLGEPGRAGKH